MKKILIYTTIFITLLSCDKESKDGNCAEFRIGYVTNVNAPTNANINANINIETDFGVINGCGFFNKFKEEINGNTRTIEVEVKYEGCICTQAAETKRVDYEFQTLEIGVYTFKFKKSEDEFNTVIINVE